MIAVEDSGPGIPVEKRKHMFDRFQKSLDQQSQGTGIGLNLCKILMDAMGGTIHLDETYDSGVPSQRGTRIVLALNQQPLDKSMTHREEDPRAIVEDKKDHDSQSTTETLPNSSSGSCRIENSNYDGLSEQHTGGEDVCSPTLPQHARVLLVDDERILRKLASRSILRECPEWQVREAASGETALQLCQDEDFDLILMDQYMTSTERQLTGTETTRTLRARGCTAIICGLSANDLGSSFTKAGADDFILKPFPCKPNELRETLIRLMACSRKDRETEQS